MTIKIGVLTSGGDAPGMNAAVRAVVRTGLYCGAEVYAIYEGYRGMIEGRIRPLAWHDVGGILHRGGTVIGSARCQEFRTREGRLTAAFNLIRHGIDRLVVIGGDGSLTGADLFRREWPSLLEELQADGRISAEAAATHAQLTIAGLAGSIDNDLCGTDMTIGADTALHRITEAVDAISSTAASHQRSFVVEVMGRKCGYLAMMGAIASGADWALIPESPPNLDAWEDKMCSVLKAGREMGRRDSIVIVAEGATDRYGKPISAGYVKQVLEDRLGEDTRVTILGHVQRGGSPSVYDRNLSTMTGARAVEAILDDDFRGQGFLVGVKGNRLTEVSLEQALADTREVAKAIDERDFERAMELRGGTFREAWRILRTLVRARPHEPIPGKPRRRFAVLCSGAPAPGMNPAVRAAVRLGVDKGHIMFGVYNGMQGLIDGDIEEFDWMSVNGWMNTGGAELGSNRSRPVGHDFYHLARNIERYEIDGLLIIGGWDAYIAAMSIHEQREHYPAFEIPIVCLPASIDNNLPASELSMGSDTALQNIMEAIDKIKQSAVASRRVFVVEVMGRYCGYLALMSGLATGAERVYLPEEGFSLTDLVREVDELITGFRQGKRLGMVIRSEWAHKTYDTSFMCSLFAEEGEGLFDVRKAVLGHIQQGGDPTPFDRIMGVRLALRCIDYLEGQAASKAPKSACIGLLGTRVQFTEFADMMRDMDMAHMRSKSAWWMAVRPTARILALPGPAPEEDVATNAVEAAA